MTTTARLMSVYSEVLQHRLGWEVQSIDDGDLVADADGLAIGIRADGGDPSFVECYAPFHLERGDLSRRRAIAEETTRVVKLAKVSVDDHGFLCTVDVVVAPPDCLPAAAHLAAVLPRVRSSLTTAARHFARLLAESGETEVDGRPAG